MKHGVLLLFALCTITAIVSISSAAPPLRAIDAYNQGVDFAMVGNFSEALDYIDLALSLDQNFTLAWITRAGILNEMGDYNQSLEASDQALALDKGQAEAWITRAVSLIHLDQNTEALDAADEAIQLDPRQSEAWAYRAVALSNLNRTKESSEALQMLKFLTEEPESTTIQVTMTPTTKAPLSWLLVPLSLGAMLGYSRIRRGNKP